MKNTIIYFFIIIIIFPLVLLAATGDDCSDPIIFNAPGDLTYTDAGQTTCGRINDYSSTCLNSYDGGEDIIYQMNVTSDITVNISLTSDATWVGVVIDDACPPASSGCVDYCTSSGSSCSITDVFLSTGTYYIMVDTWPSPTCINNFTLTVEQVGGSTDPCDDITSIGGCGAGYTQTFSADGGGEWSTSYCGASTPGAEKVYSFVAPATGTYNVVVTSVNSGLHVDYGWRSGSCSETGWTCIGQINSSGTYGSMSWTSGTTYYILLDPEFPSAITHQFYINCPVGCISPSNEACAGATTVTYAEIASGYSDSGELGCSDDCSGRGYYDVFYRYDCTCTGSYTMDMCDSYGDTYMRLYSGSCCGTYVTSNDDGCGSLDPSLTYTLNSGTTYWIECGSYYSTTEYENAAYNYNMTTTCTPTVDPCDAIISIGGCGSGYTQTYSENGSGEWDTYLCYNYDYGIEQVYSFVAPTTGNYSIQVVSASPSYSSVDYGWQDSCSETGWNCISGVSSAGNYGSMSWTAGLTYYIILDGRGSSTSYTHQFYVRCPAAGDDCTNPIVVNLPSALPYMDFGQTTCGRADNYSSTCLGLYDSGEDIIYRLNVSSEVTVNIILDPNSTTYTGFCIDNSCPPDGTCLDYSTNSSASSHTIYGVTLSPGSYYIMVDTYSGPDCIPDFDLRIEEASPGTNCSDPIEVTLPAALPYLDLAQTTCGRVDDYTSTCLGSYDEGEDIIYQVTVTSAITVDITLDPNSTTYTGICIDDACPPALSCIEYSTSSSAAVHGMNGVYLTPGIYYIMVDTWGSSPDCIPDFDLSIQLSPEGTNCYNAINVNIPSELTYIDAGQTTCGMVDDYDATCLYSYDGGEDIIYELNVSSATRVNITLDPHSTGWTGICIDDACPPASSCIDYSTNTAASSHGMNGVDLSVGTYYIMVDIYPSPSCIPTFDLTIEETPEGNSCSDPIIVNIPAALPYLDANQTTCGMVDDYDATCLVLYDNGEDIIYRLNVTSPTIVNIMLDPKTTSWSGILIDNACPPDMTCIDYSTNSSASEHGMYGVSLAVGTYYIMVDTYPSPDCIPDFDLSITTYIPPDLIIESVWPSDATPCVGGLIAWNARVRNNSAYDAGNSVVYFYDEVTDCGSGYVDFAYVPVLLAGESYVVTTGTNFYALDGGVYYFSAEADAEDDVPESNESNNCGYGSVTYQNACNCVTTMALSTLYSGDLPNYSDIWGEVADYPLDAPSAVWHASEKVYAFTPISSGDYTLTVTGTVGYTGFWYTGVNCGPSFAGWHYTGSTSQDFTLTASNTYYVIVDQYSSGYPYSLRWDPPCIPATIVTHPTSEIVCAGDPVTFTVTASGTAPLSYQWKKDGGNIGSATSNSYTIPSVSPADAGDYTCVVSNTCGSEESNVATLTVEEAPNITDHPVNSTVFEGGNTAFSIIATGAGLLYQWQVDSGLGWTNIAVAGSGPTYNNWTTATLLVNGVILANDGNRYRCIVTGNCPPPDTSEAGTLFVDSLPGGCPLPRVMNYQGKLTDPEGVAIAGSTVIDFGIYDAVVGGTILWAETLWVTLHNGLFDVLLGTVHPIDLDFCMPYWMELIVSPDGVTGWEKLSPREKLATVPYAFRSLYADTAEYARSGGGFRSSGGRLEFVEVFSEEYRVSDECRTEGCWESFPMGGIVTEDAQAVELSVSFVASEGERISGNWGARMEGSVLERVFPYRSEGEGYMVSITVPIGMRGMIELYDDNAIEPYGETGARFRVVGYWITR